MQKSTITLLAVSMLWSFCCSASAQPVPKRLNVDAFGKTLDAQVTAEPPAIVLQKAKGMSDEKAYEYLLGWVVPGAGKPNFKMQFEIMTLEQQRSLPEKSAEFDRFQSPALELIKLAKKLEKLDDLLQHINVADASSSKDTRAKSSLLTLIYAEQSKWDLAKAEIEKLTAIAERPLPADMSVEDRAAEFYVVLFASRKLPLYVDAYVLGSALQVHERNMQTHATDWDWVKLLTGAMSTANRFHAGDVVGPKLKQWTSVPNTTAIQSARGLRPSVWHMEKGTLKHDAGETWSSLYFQSPLRGQFEIVAVRSTYNYGEMLVAIGMHSAEPLFNLKGHRVHRALLGTIELGPEIQMHVWDYSAKFRIVVDGNKVTTYTNDVLIHEEQFNAPIDPWLVLQAEFPNGAKFVKSLEILGAPEIPEEIDLVNVADAGGWRVNYYEYCGYENPVGRYYKFESDEIQGTLQNRSTSRLYESFLKYSRPMLEDGEFEYEFYYEPGKYEVHPVLGMNAIMLNEQTAVVHPLSDGYADRSGRTPDAMEELADAKKPNLKSGNWNHVLLKLTGDQVSVSVNGDQIATRKISEHANERFFGLFRYVNHQQMRVRNAKYRGDWPKKLPSLDDQELAEK